MTKINTPEKIAARAGLRLTVILSFHSKKFERDAKMTGVNGILVNGQ
jgi:hypothetical protein